MKTHTEAEGGGSKKGEVFRSLQRIRFHWLFFQSRGFCGATISRGAAGITWSRIVTVEGLQKS